MKVIINAPSTFKKLATNDNKKISSFKQFKVN
jgi:hypothetical protein